MESVCVYHSKPAVSTSSSAVILHSSDFSPGKYQEVPRGLPLAGGDGGVGGIHCLCVCVCSCVCYRSFTLCILSECHTVYGRRVLRSSLPCEL